MGGVTSSVNEDEKSSDLMLESNETNGNSARMKVKY